jgi:uncharacterized protein
MDIEFLDDRQKRLTALLDGRPAGTIEYYLLAADPAEDESGTEGGGEVGEEDSREATDPANTGKTGAAGIIRVGVHTEVDPDFQGRGVAGALAAEFYRLAAAADQPVVPLCPYLTAWAELHPDQAPDPGTDAVRRAARRLRQDPSLW